jgi:hypothetical protein
MSVFVLRTMALLQGSMVQDMFSILDVQHRFLPLYGMSKDGAKLSAVQAQRARITLSRTNEAAAKAKIDAELSNRGGFIPLMGHFPVLRFGAAGRSSDATAAAEEPAGGDAAAGDEAAAGEVHEQPSAVSELQQADDGVQPPAGAGRSAAGGEGSQSGGVLFTDSDKRLFVYMQQWWQRHKTAGKKRRKRSKLADGAIAPAVAAPDRASAAPMQVDEPAPV